MNTHFSKHLSTTPGVFNPINIHWAPPVYLVGQVCVWMIHCKIQVYSSDFISPHVKENDQTLRWAGEMDTQTQSIQGQTCIHTQLTYHRHKVHKSWGNGHTDTEYTSTDMHTYTANIPQTSSTQGQTYTANIPQTSSTHGQTYIHS